MRSATNKILVATVVLLLIANIALVTLMLTGKNKRSKGHSKNENADMMARELHMTEAQKQKHQQMRDEHFKAMRPYFDSVRLAKTELFSLLKQDNVSDSVYTQYSLRITERQSVIDKLTFDHFKRMRDMLTPDQRPKFDDFLQKMMQRNRKDSGRKDN